MATSPAQWKRKSRKAISDTEALPAKVGTGFALRQRDQTKNNMEKKKQEGYF